MLVTLAAITVNPALMRPAGTITCEDVVAYELLLDSVTAVPPDAAEVARVTVHEAIEPPFKVVGLQISEATPG
jgi:hypothetical protein